MSENKQQTVRPLSQNATPSWFFLMRYDTIRYDTIRYVTLRYDTIRYDTIRYDTIRYDTIRYDTIPYDVYRMSWHDSCNALVSSQRHSYRTLPYIVSHPSDIVSHERSECDIMSEGCDTNVSDSIRVRYKNHAMMFYLSLNCSIAELA